MATTTDKLLVFTDLHFGIHSNSPSYIDICSNTMKWIKEYAIDKGIHSILFMGDFFDSRASIDVKTLNSATESLYDIADNGIFITMILGNHDIYLRDSTSIHSLFAFNGHHGIRVLDKPIVEEMNGFSVMLNPWQYCTANGTQVNIPGNVKYVFCHHNFPVDFFFNNSTGNGRKRKHKSDTFVNMNKYTDEFGFQKGLVEKVLENEGTIFSGHIHNRMEIPIGDNGKSKIIIEGSPYETNWGFGKSECGIYLVDMINGTYEFIPNPYSMKHREIRTSDFDADFGSVDFGNSIVRLMVDTQESFDTISKMQNRIQQMKPFSVETTKYEFTKAEFIGNRVEIDSENAVDSITHGVSSKLDYIKNAIDTADFSAFSYMKNNENAPINRNRLKEIATELFEKGNK